jgi:hypothetical protein
MVESHQICSTVASPFVISTGLRLMNDFGGPKDLPFHLRRIRIFPFVQSMAFHASASTFTSGSDIFANHRGGFSTAELNRFELRFDWRGHEFHRVVFVDLARFPCGINPRFNPWLNTALIALRNLLRSAQRGQSRRASAADLRTATTTGVRCRLPAQFEELHRSFRGTGMVPRG